MSSRSQLVAEAIYLKTNVVAVVGSGKFSAIYLDVASNQATPYRYGIFSRQAPEPHQYSFGPTRILEGDLWLFKAVVDEAAQTAVSPQKHAETLLADWITTLGETLTLSGAVVAWMEPFADMPPFQEKLGDRWVFHRGTLMLIRTE